VAEMDMVLSDLRTGDTHPIERVFSEEPITAKALALSLDTDADDLLSLPCGQLSLLIDQVKACNPFFVRRMGKLAAILQTMARENTEEIEAQTAPLPSSAEISAG
ncbi:MAG: hypothetical protein Q8R88_00355, partial [Desulfoprunum sp.]|nr:hypothetical protein [Desulfoprunum sp.]